jgi:hypothetical protein
MLSNCHIKTIFCIMMPSWSKLSKSLMGGGMVQFPKVFLHRLFPDTSNYQPPVKLPIPGSTPGKGFSEM